MATGMLTHIEGVEVVIIDDEEAEAQEFRVDFEASLQEDIAKEKGFSKKLLRAMAEDQRQHAAAFAEAARILASDGAAPTQLSPTLPSRLPFPLTYPPSPA